MNYKYEIIYIDNKAHSINKIWTDGLCESFPIDESYKAYKKYLIDVENGVEVIDNQPSDSEIAKVKALNELAATDSKVPRVIEDIYDVLSATQKSNLATPTKQSIEDKKAKRQAYLDLL